MSHAAGHGDVTLPADYVREHVRLGYAATEHGWQSDTVDTAIALASPATTRRGLYVAATRGRDNNTMCVITDSDDVAEARDVLEAIIAIDRADIPAVTQRRSLAQSTPTHPTPAAPAHTPRCAIPDWFPSALADAQQALRDAEAREAEQSAQRADVTADVANADAVYAEVHAATAADRDALHHAEARTVEARRRQTAAQHRLDNAPRRHRRALRHELNEAEQQLERAENYLARTRQRTAPAVEQHAHALAAQRDAHDQLRNHELSDSLDAMLPTVGEHRLHVRSLTTWHHWAQGHDVPDQELHGAFAVLARQPGAERQLAATLRDQLGTPHHAVRPGHHLDDPGERAAGRDLGIEL